MDATGKRWVMLVVAAVAVAAGIVIAVSGSGGHRHGGAPRILKTDAASGGASGGGGGTAGGNSAADDTGQGHNSTAPSRTVVASGYLGVSPSKLSRRVKTGSSLGQIADATSGKSAAGLIDAMVAARASKLKKLGLPASVERTRVAHYRERITYIVERVKAAPALERDLRAASQYLGVTSRELHTQLQQGKTLAQLTEADAASGKSISGLTKAILAVRQARLQALLAEHQITQANEKKALGELPALVARELHRKQLQPG
jgi:hypothetical protein